MLVTSTQIFHKENLDTLIFPFLSQKDRESLGLVDKTWRLAKLKFEVKAYIVLKDRIRGKKTVFVRDGQGSHLEMLLGVLGKGGSKKAIELQEGRALILPNMDVDSMYEIILRWKRMVHEEVAMSQTLTKIGIMSPLSERVTISLSEDSREGTIPAYLSQTFENLGKTKGWFIIDTKNSDSSTWIQGKNFLFNSEEDRLNEKNWDSVVNSMLTDITKLHIYKIPAGGDSLNIAVVKKPSELSICQYEVRYFGFDFSSKHALLDIPKIQENTSLSPTVDFNPTRPINNILDTIFSYEFGLRYDFNNGKETEKLKNLKDNLVKRYAEGLIAQYKK